MSGPGDQVEVGRPDGTTVTLGPLRAEDHDALYAIFDEVVASGAGYPHQAPLTEESFGATWLAPSVSVTVARTGERVLGAYYLKPNFVGRAAHIANAGYVVERAGRGQGTGRLLLQDSIRRAPLLGYDAIQFNLVFESNPARRLYEELGWREIGRVPQAVEGEDALIYWRAVR